MRKVQKMIKKVNPRSQKVMAKSCGISVAPIKGIIHQDLLQKTWKKTSGHILKPEHCANRKTDARKQHERHLTGGKSEYMVTLDEACVYLSNSNGQRSICYSERGSTLPDQCMVKCKDSWSIGWLSDR
jgi:hypothetical protein